MRDNVTQRLARNNICRRAETAAYLDGELTATAAASFEGHLKECVRCSAALLDQRRLLCLLDAAFDEKLRQEVALPADFARVVTARAQTDMRGLRRRSEHCVALKICAMLAVAGFALMGAAAFDVVLVPLLDAARAVSGALGMLAHALVNAGVGAVLVLRAFGGHLLIAGPYPLHYLRWILLAGAALLLLRLIGNYHRATINDRDPS